MKEMKKKKSGISEDVIFIFENILNKHKDEQGRLNLTGVVCFQPEWDDEFCEAMNKHLTKEQRFRLY